MKSIGGYFELELNKSGEYHQHAIRLNTGRNALEYILQSNQYQKIYLPFFTCDVLLQPIHKLKINYEFYKIDEKLEPIFDFGNISENECFIYTNYFGLKNEYIERISTLCKNLIVDNAQAFYSKAIDSIDTFYSPRKYFGVSDGAYLFSNKLINEDFQFDISNNRMAHLLIRSDQNAEDGYNHFLKNDQLLSNQEICLMSAISNKILNSIDYNQIKLIRKSNFDYLNTALGELNKFNWTINENEVPMVYPFWTNKKEVKEKLIQNKIYVATYWPNVLEWCESSSLEAQLTNEVLALPIDQRYGANDMDRIISIIKNG